MADDQTLPTADQAFPDIAPTAPSAATQRLPTANEAFPDEVAGGNDYVKNAEHMLGHTIMIGARSMLTGTSALHSSAEFLDRPFKSVDRITDAFTKGASDELASAGLTQEQQDWFRKVGIFNDTQTQVKTGQDVAKYFLRNAAEALLRGGAYGVEALGAPVVGAVEATKQTAIEAGAKPEVANKEVELASQELFGHFPLGTASMGIGPTRVKPSEIGPSIRTGTPPVITKGVATHALSSEEVYLGTQPPSAQERLDAYMATPDVEPAEIPPAPEQKPPADIHEAARNINPNLIDEYNRQRGQEQTLGQWMRELSGKRQAEAEKNNPFTSQISEVEKQISDIQEAKKGGHGKIQSLQDKIEALKEQSDEWLQSETAKDNPDIAHVRDALGRIRSRLYEMAPDVSATYRAASEFFPEKEPSKPVESPSITAEAPIKEPEAPSTAPAAEEPPAPAPAPKEIPKEPQLALRTAEEQRQAIVDDFTKKWVAAGHNAEEARQFGGYVALRFQQLAERLKTGKTAEELYKERSANVRLSTGKEKKVRGRELEQTFDKTKQGDQSVIPGAEKISDRELAERKMQEKLRSSKDQKEMDIGLFGEDHKQTELFQQAKGKIRLATKSAKAMITRFQKADFSTMVHETGHEWLEDMQRDAANPAAAEDLKKDFETVKKYLGVEEGKAITTAQHEKFARSFERYFMDGIAPTRALAKVFEQFKQWMTSIYKWIDKSRYPINDEIRGVFDRFIAPQSDTVIAPEPHQSEQSPAPAGPWGQEPAAAQESKSVDEQRQAALFEHSTPEQRQSSLFTAAQTPAAAAPPPQSPQRPAAPATVYTKIPRRPLTLSEWVRKNGGIKDPGGDVRHTLGGEHGNRLIRPKAGKNIDDVALAAWEQGYFTGDRPSVNDFLDKLNEDLKGNHQFSEKDRADLDAYNDALAHNDQIDKLSEQYDIKIEGKTAGEFWDAVAEHQSKEEFDHINIEMAEAATKEMEKWEAKHQDWLETRGEAWEPDTISSRTLEDLENEWQQEKDAGDVLQGKTGPWGSESTPRDAGGVQVGNGQGGGSPADAGSSGAQGSALPGTGRSKPAAGSDRPTNTIKEHPGSPTAKFGESKSDLVDKAGNIRIDLLNSTADADDVIRQIAKENNDFMPERRGVISNGMSLDLADALGMDPALVNMRKIGDAFNAEQIAAAVKLLIQSAKDVSEKAKAGDIEAYLEAKERHKMIQGHVSGVTAEAGRALQIFQALKKMEGFDEASAMSSFLKDHDNGKDLFQLEEEMKYAAKLDTPQQMSLFIEESKKASFKGMVVEYYVNSLLSGPITHLRYSVGNAINAIVTPLFEIPSAAAIGMVKEAISGKAPENRVYFGEASAQIYAMTKGARDGVSAAIDAFRANQSPLLPGERTGAFSLEQKKPAIPGAIGTAINVPSRSVAAIHSFFKTLRYEQNIAGLAYRAAVKEGLEGDALAARVSDLTVRPTEDMMKSATADALRELYMAPTEYHSAMGYLQRFTNSWLPAKIIMPFMKIGTQITRNAFLERTPLGIFSNEVRANLLGVNGEAARDIQMGKMFIGTSLIGSTALMVMEGMATGDGPTDPNQRRVWLLNHRPNTMTIGNVTIPYQGLGSYGMLMRFSANMTETAQGWDDEEGSKLAVSAMEGLTKAVLDDNFMRGVKDMTDAVYHPQEYGARYLQNFATNWLPFSTGLGQMNREFVDEYRRDVHSHGMDNAWGVFDAARSRIPGLSQGLYPQRDMFGNAIQNTSNYEQYKNDPVVQKLDELHVGVSKVPRKITNVQLTDAQYDDFSQLSGQFTKQRLDALVALPGFNDLPQGVQIQVIEKTIGQARESARKIIKLENPDIIEQASAKKQAIFAGQPTK